MRDKHYKNRSFRISEEIYENLKKQRGEDSWNLFFRKLLYEKKATNNETNERRKKRGEKVEKEI